MEINRPPPHSDARLHDSILCSSHSHLPAALLCGVRCVDLHDPIDVYSEWIDETEKANRVTEDERPRRALAPPPPVSAAARRTWTADGDERRRTATRSTATPTRDEEDDEERARARQKRPQEEQQK